MESLWSLCAKSDAEAHSVRRTHDWNWRRNQLSVAEEEKLCNQDVEKVMRMTEI